MKRMNFLKRLSVAVATASLLVSVSARGQETSQGPIVQGITKPYVHAKPGVNTFGTVFELPVKEGQQVKAGDILLRQDDRQERAELEKLELEAASNVRVEAADADLKIKQLQLTRVKELAANGNSSPFEVEDAQSKVIYADAQAKIARLELEKAKRDAEKQRVKVDQMNIKSPVNGRVESIDVAVGDTSDPQKPVMSVVQNDPLKVEFYLPVSQASKLKMGDDVQVRYPTEEQWLAAKVTFKSPFADAASDTQKIVLEMKYGDGRDSGLQVQVRLPAGVAPTAAANVGKP